MKKIAVFLIIALCFALCACNEADENLPPVAKDVHITAGKIAPGMTAKDILVEVTIDRQPVACRVALTAFTPTGFYEMEEDQPIPEDFCVRLDVFYSLPKGYDVDNINVTMDCDGGEYDGTGSISSDKNGCVEAWSHAMYGEIKEESTVHPVNIKVTEFSPGMTVNRIKVEVTVDEKPVEARITASLLTDQGIADLESTDIIPDKSAIRLNVFYYLDHGITVDDIEVTMDFPDAEYDGTGSISTHEDGREEAWSHALYDKSEKPTEDPVEEPEPTDPEPIEPPHTHSWVEQSPNYTYISCTAGGTKTYICECGQTKTENIPAPGHSLKDGIITNPTCTEPGSQTQTCTRCGAVFINQLPATGHSWSAWVKETGVKHKHTCTVCGAEEAENHTIPSGSVTCTGCGEDIIN